MAPNERPLIALFNYGGGMRGLIPAHIMSRIEKTTGLRMADMVDVFCGPSTGSILNAALTLRHPDKPDRPKYRARHMVRFYEREGLNIFPADRFREFRGLIHDFNNRMMKIGQLNAIFRQGHYNTANLSRSLNALYGDAKLADSLRSLVIPAYNIDGEQLTVIEEAGETDETPVHTMNNFTDSGGHALWMKNILFNTDMNTHKPPLNVTLYDAVMASAAAPTYFPCHHFKASQPGIAAEHEYTAIDGSIFDNPCISYAGALRQHLTPGQKLVMIGLGTGTVNRSVKKEAWNSYGSLGVVDPVNDLPLINILFHASESALMESFAAEMSGHLYLFNKSLVKDREKDWPNTQLDDGSPENLKKLKNFAELIIEENQALFDEVCHILATNRDRMEKEKPFLDKLKTKIFSSS
ncbi:MAG: patatin-like phospholipase family protein [Rhodospirillales bacterium]|nr:patatin-like phospholipase family protein [Alphaproteobacteria bacterium]USO03038.1 MAG: patatin-like phospholipase family protein [Rhodospirillales bacterium]